ncbi:TIR domain-containing protein [Serpentinicella alkaliphila]|uniref:Putative nucleotide-binding protein with TIR-like domain n=1 Tax=Serpentinicella alkaliphila TaxID=1734049 RepID=A0A4R2TWA4_9FIRM|nr:nucleotide-binding protein [Serpentinicella alkaliphila]QUH25547.1 nucleotide-binding protein [Serpentinicella alkaliphila]TCQ01899.1 putative nucleotide-binding protein with TIR-like domain [Serpentinicella alkaliphila]
MVTKKTKEIKIGSPQVPPHKGIELLTTQIEKGNKLLNSRPLTSDDYDSWELLTRNYLEKAFGVGSPNVSSIMDIGKYGAFSMDAGPSYWENRRAESLQSQLKNMNGLIELLRTELELTEESVISNNIDHFGNRVFLVHGHNEAALHETARFIEKLDQEIIVLREQPNGGKTIIEKFEEYSNVGFAVVLLTPDDKGCLINEDDSKVRQNVIFELGYFIGKLGRNRVCALYHSGVELPSDYSGILFVLQDEKGAWRLDLAKEMKAAGLNIDMNKAL